MASAFRNADLTGLKLKEPFPDSAFDQAHKPRGEHVMDAFWDNKKWPRTLKRELGVPDDKDPLRPTFGKKADRPASALTSQGRPLSAAGARRSRPGTAPSGGRILAKPVRPPSATGFPWDAAGTGQGPVFYTKCAKDLREDFKSKQEHNAKFDLKHLIAKTGEDAHDLCLSQASTEDGGDEIDDGDSDDSQLEDEERLARAFKRVERFMQVAETATMLANSLKAENEQHLLEIESLSGSIEQYEEKVLFLEESEIAWREKNTVLRDRDAMHCSNLEHARMNRCDLEDRTRPLDLRMNLVRKKLRRNAMTYDQMGDRFSSQRSTEELGLLWQAWRSEHDKAMLCKGTTVEEMRDNKHQLDEQQARIAELEEQLEEIPRLMDRLHGAHADIGKLGFFKSKVIDLLQGRVCKFRQTGDKPVIKSAMKIWMKAMPILRLEREQMKLRQEHEELKDNYIALHQQLVALQNKMDDDPRLATLRTQLAVALDRQGVLEEDVHATSERSIARLETIQTLTLQYESEMQDARQNWQAMEVALRTEIAEGNEVWQRRFSAAVKEHAAQTATLRSEADELEARVDDLLEALHLDGDASGDGRSTRLPRVVPRSKGVLCAGCMTQILHRDVRPLQSVEEIQAPANHLEEEKAALFGNTLGGPDPDNSAHSFLWHRRKDPPKSVLEGTMPSPKRREAARRPQSAVGRSCRRVDALREEVAGFRTSWRG